MGCTKNDITRERGVGSSPDFVYKTKTSTKNETEFSKFSQLALPLAKKKLIAAETFSIVLSLRKRGCARDFEYIFY